MVTKFVVCSLRWQVLKIHQQSILPAESLHTSKYACIVIIYEPITFKHIPRTSKDILDSLKAERMTTQN